MKLREQRGEVMTVQHEDTVEDQQESARNSETSHRAQHLDDSSVDSHTGSRSSEQTLNHPSPPVSGDARAKLPENRSHSSPKPIAFHSERTDHLDGSTPEVSSRQRMPLPASSKDLLWLIPDDGW